LWLGIGLLAAMFAASYLGEKDSNLFSMGFLGLAVTAAIGITGFFRHINRRDDPFLAPRFIYGKGFGAVNLFNIVYSGTTSGVLSLVPLYAASRYGIDAMDSATLLIAQGVASVILSTLMTYFLRQTGYRPPLYIGAAIIALGVGCLAMPPGL